MSLVKLHSQDKFDRHLDTITIGRNIAFCGGGSPPPAPTNTTVTNTNLPAYLEPYVTRNVASAEAIANNPYTPYTGQRTAGFTPAQTAAQTGILGLGAPTQFGQASNILAGQNVADAYQPAGTNLAGAITGTQGINVAGAYAPGMGNLAAAGAGVQGIAQPGQFGTASTATQAAMNQMWTDPAMVAAYMNPYQQAVSDIAKREAQRQADIQMTGRSAQFAKAGAFGGSRQGIADAEAQRNLLQLQNDIQMQGANQAYQTGMFQFNADLARQMSGASQLANIGNMQFQDQLQQQQALAAIGAQQAQFGGQLAGQELAQQQQVGALAGQQARLAGQQLSAEQAQAAGLASLGQTQQATDLARLNAQMGVGQQQQALTQQQMDIAYQDFINQRDYGKQQANWMAGLLHGTPTTAQSNVIQYAPTPNVAGQLAGLGIAGLGAYNAATGTKV